MGMNYEEMNKSRKRNLIHKKEKRKEREGKEIYRWITGSDS